MSSEEKSGRNKRPVITKEDVEYLRQVLNTNGKNPKYRITALDVVTELQAEIRMCVVENRYDWEEVAAWLSGTGILQISANTLRKYYFDATGEVDPGSPGKRRRSKPEPSVSQQKPEQSKQAVNPEATKPSPNPVNPVPDVPDVVQELEPPAAPPDSPPEPAKTDDKPKPKKKLTMLERLKLMSDDDDVYVPDDDEEEDDDDAPVIRGNFSIMPPDDEL